MKQFIKWITPQGQSQQDWQYFFTPSLKMMIRYLLFLEKVGEEMNESSNDRPVRVVETQFIDCR